MTRFSSFVRLSPGVILGSKSAILNTPVIFLHVSLKLKTQCAGKLKTGSSTLHSG